MPLPGQVFHQHNPAGADWMHRAVAEADFPLAGKGDDVVAAGLDVPIAELARLLYPEPDAGYLLQGRRVGEGGSFQFFQVGLTVLRRYRYG